MLARLGEREAMRSLAHAVQEEERSVSLKRRSQSLATGYSNRLASGEEESSGTQIAALSRFAGSLATLARDAHKAHADAADQTRWQADALAAAQSKSRRQQERLGAAKDALNEMRVAREAADASLARELQKNRNTQ